MSKIATTKQPIVFLTESQNGEKQTVVRAVMYQPRIAKVNDSTIIAIASLCIKTLGQRHGIIRAKEIVEATLLSG